MDKSNVPLDPNADPYNGFFNPAPMGFQEPPRPMFHAETYTVRHRSLFSRNGHVVSRSLSDSVSSVSFSQVSDVNGHDLVQNMRTCEDDNEMGEPSIFDDSMTQSPQTSSASLSRSSSMISEPDQSQDPNTQTPVVTCLTPPLDDVPTRCESVKPFASLIEDDSQASESPCKFPRLGDFNGITSRTFERPAMRRPQSRLSRLRGVTLSVSSLPTPEFPLLVTPSETSSHVVLDGLTIPVIPGIRGHSNKQIRISPETTYDFISGKIKLPLGYKLLIWDARFLYEYEGGHIRGARRFEVKNIRSQLEEIVRDARVKDERYYVLCYCQFSSSRAPKLRDILYCAEDDIKLAERRGIQLLSEEGSRFRVFIVDGGYDSFYAKYPEMCEPRGYTRELDDLEARGKYRPEYEEDIKGACASRALIPSPATLIRRSQSSRDFRGRTRSTFHFENQENNMGRNDLYSGISDDETEVVSPSVSDNRVRPLFFDDDM